MLAHRDAAWPDASVDPGDPHHELRFRGCAVADCGGRRLGDKDLDRQRMVDYIAAEIRIVAVWLDSLVPTLGASQKCIPTGLRRRDPVVSPAPPRIAVYRIEELALDP